MSERSDLLSSVDADYASLHSLLASSQWQKADEETGAVMLKIARRVTAGWLTEEDIKDFPVRLANDKSTVGEVQPRALWLQCSKRRCLLAAR